MNVEMERLAEEPNRTGIENQLFRCFPCGMRYVFQSQVHSDLVTRYSEISLNTHWIFILQVHKRPDKKFG